MNAHKLWLLCMVSIDRVHFNMTFGNRIALCVCMLPFIVVVHCLHSTFSLDWNCRSWQMTRTKTSKNWTNYFSSIFLSVFFFLIEYYQFCTKRIPFIILLKYALSSNLTCDLINIISFSYFFIFIFFFSY